MIATTPELQRRRYATSDPDEARDFLDQGYRLGGLRVTAPTDDDWRVDISEIDAGQYSLGHVRLPAESESRIEAFDDRVLFARVLRGWSSHENSKHAARYGPGDLFIARTPEVEWTCRTHQLTGSVVSMSMDLLNEVSGRSADRPGTQWRPLSYEPLPGRAAQWRRANRFVEELLRDTGHAVNPLLVGSAGRLLAAAAIAVFASAVDGVPTVADRRDAHPQTLHRAMSYIEDNPDLDISAADIARAAHTSQRAVQLAFRRHLDTTPMAYLRRVRLECAHEELSIAGPGNGTTVAGVAQRWGFTQTGFVRQYREAFGEPPSRTLNRP